MPGGGRKIRGGQSLARELKEICDWARTWTGSFGDADSTEEGRAFVDRFEREARVVFSRYDRARRALAPPYSIKVNDDERTKGGPDGG